MNCDWKLKLRSHSSSYCLLEVVTGGFGGGGGGVMVFNSAFNNLSNILWRSVLLVEEAGVHR